MRHRDANDQLYLELNNPQFSTRSEKVAQARARSWYARTPYGIAVLRYDAVKELLLHRLLRQGSYRWPEHNNAAGLWAQWWKRIMLNVEGEEHARLRRLAQPAFAPRRVEGLLPTFRALAEDLVAGFETHGRCEFMGAFAIPFAARAICALIGLADESWRGISKAAVEMGLALSVDYPRHEARVDAATETLMGFARMLIGERRRAPKDDFIGALIAARDERDALSEQELVDMIVLTIFGGIDTTQNQLGLAMLTFVERPDQWARLARNPELARHAVEEVMRMRPTVTWVTREALEDFTYRGLEIPKGTTIHLLTHAAGTDPAHFSGGFDIAAERKPHFGFGKGRHHCIGAPIARADMAEALKVLARRLRNPALDGEPVLLPESGNTGPLSLPIRFEPVG